MRMISPVLGAAYALLRMDIYAYLDDVEYLAGADVWTTAEQEMVRRVVADLVTVVRGMVAGHEASGTGQCKSCGTPWPCDITETVHRLVKDPDRAFVDILKHVRDS